MKERRQRVIIALKLYSQVCGSETFFYFMQKFDKEIR